MAVWQVAVEGLGTVNLHRRKGVRNVRLRLDAEGGVHVVVPWFAPKALGLAFVEEHRQWIEKHQNSSVRTIQDGVLVNQKYRVVLKPTDGKVIKTKLAGADIVVSLPSTKAIEDEATQRALKKKITEVIKTEAQEVLGPKLYKLANRHKIDFADVSVRILRSRWGSCSQEKQIVLNAFAVQLPENLQEYVLLHELTHTRHMHHKKAFWDDLEQICPDAKSRRKELKDYRPALQLSHPNEALMA